MFPLTYNIEQYWKNDAGPLGHLPCGHSSAQEKDKLASAPDGTATVEFAQQRFSKFCYCVTFSPLSNTSTD